MNLKSENNIINVSKNNSETSLKQFALNFAKIYDQGSKKFIN